MSSPTITNFDPQDGVRAVEHSEQTVLTSAGAVTTYRLTILGRVTSTGKWAPYSAGDSPAGTNIARAISLSEVVSDGAGDDAVGVMLIGEVDEAKIRIHGGNAGENITNLIKDSLRSYGIRVVSKTEMNDLDNQS